MRLASLQRTPFGLQQRSQRCFTVASQVFYFKGQNAIETIPVIGDAAMWPGYVQHLGLEADLLLASHPLEYGCIGAAKAYPTFQPL